MWRRPATRERRGAGLGEPVYKTLSEEGDTSPVARALTCSSDEARHLTSTRCHSGAATHLLPAGGRLNSCVAGDT
ncbi:hypothetical protein O3P69_020136 [Scylla paramamosain]|uniref:Uncharacterized protein n=1 Tax=Scylla paramamosain TaxID=85552 RepID=A0AAW0TN21_SCYPA